MREEKLVKTCNISSLLSNGNESLHVTVVGSCTRHAQTMVMKGIQAIVVSVMMYTASYVSYSCN